MNRREILFRGKRMDNGEWVEGSLLQSEATVGGRTNCEIVGRFAFANDIGRYEVYPSTVGQFTGLTDKNGVKIWEGDIVEAMDLWNTKKIQGQVVFSHIGFQSETLDGYKDREYLYELTKNDRAEIIGTIHDTHLTKQS